MADAFTGMAVFLGTLGSFATALPAILDERLGALAPVVAGAATALAVAIAMAVYFRSGYRTSRDIVRHGLATIAVISLLAFAATDVRRAAFSYLGLNPTKPAVEFEIRMPKAAVFATLAAEAQVELHTDKNHALARLEPSFASTADGRDILRGSVRLDFRTADRIMVLNLPGEKQRLFKLRLAASPSASSEFGPWHLADRVVLADHANAGGERFAIRYRVI